MGILDLPYEIFQCIVDLLISTTTLREGFRLREVHSRWARHVEKLYMERRSEFFKTRPFIHEKDRLSTTALFLKIQDILLSSRGTSCGCLLRPSVARLMNTHELHFRDISGDTAVESEGFLEDHTQEPSRSRFVRIVDTVIATFMYSEGLEGAMDLLSGDNHMKWFWRNSNDPLEWACATAVFMEDLSAAKALLAAYSRIDLDEEGPELFSSPDSEGDIMSWGRTYLVNSLCLAVKKCSYEMVSLVLQNKAAVNEDKRGHPFETALKNACQRGSLQLVKLILQPRWELDDRNLHYLHAIAWAARCRCSYSGVEECNERIAIIETLINRTPINNIQIRRQKILAEACTWGCLIITCKMLDAGADPNARQRSNARQTELIPALIYAASHGHVELMEYLLERGAHHVYLFFQPNSIPFLEAAANPDMMAYLSNRDAPILQHGPLEQSKAEFILKTAAAKDCKRVIKFLVRTGYDLTRIAPPRSGKTPLRTNQIMLQGRSEVN